MTSNRLLLSGKENFLSSFLLGAMSGKSLDEESIFSVERFLTVTISVVALAVLAHSAKETAVSAIRFFISVRM